ncbi:hypothetical protein [Photobacterium sp. 1_MG-2023]|uniref:hypothetical protein n=1 Tax=Photobacterium sp. 1_MG-2023 TaxID=3062646 RepID=UPI0026E31B80|nr:hypothetical protein [Photobacterium sp. 1_MG-2023]MDO6704959.1 hypothetical protein [Photobacterium sp. 1_MG-2023]
MRRSLTYTAALLTTLLTACTPENRQGADLSIRFLTLLPVTSGQPHLAQIALPSHEGITFYSAQNPQVERQPFSYVTAITPEVQAYHDSVSVLPQASFPVLASNINFGLKQSGHEVYSYNGYKGRADALVRWYGGTRVAFLSLINPYPGNEQLHEQDLILLRNSVDRLQVRGIRNIVLLSQYPSGLSPRLLTEIRGLDVVISAGARSETTVTQQGCLAQFQQSALDQLELSFNPNGKVTRCHFQA